MRTLTAAGGGWGGGVRAGGGAGIITKLEKWRQKV